ncbi:solute carrier family 22 member 18 isoform X3 [Aquila chrysaetos chrysaetos]|uniref:Solute carrier family 22 member 18 n=1 Tax=Aquila chrysaetos chrysaetos TaxID=223781 RepID=A0A663EXR3_AQUCH|nr:solute carrier family 22 member 18 isoform X3 [Aquila chrysaetos chrysaetos]
MLTQHLSHPCQPAVSRSMSTMNPKASSGGEEEASGIRSKTLGKSVCSGKVERRQAILVAYLMATLELTFLFMQTGVMPYLAKSLGLDSVGLGYLQTTFGVLQLVGGPIFGRFADQFGTRAALILSCASGSAFFLLTSISTSIPLLFLSRLPAVFMHGLPGAQKLITDLTTPSQRADALGKLGLCFGIGIIIGSALGGVLSTKFGCANSSHSVPTRGRVPTGTGKQSRAMCLSHLPRPNRTQGLFLIMFSVISMDFFGLEAVESGYLMSYFGVLQMVVQGLVTGKLTNHCTERTLLRLSVFIFAGVGLGMARMRTVWHYCIIAMPMVFAFGTLGTITDSILTKAVPSSDTGTMLGICASVQPLTQTVGPTIGGVLYKQFGVSSFGYLQLIVNIGLFVYLLKSKIPLREMKSQ